MIEVDWQQIIGFVSLIGGFFLSLGKILQLFSEISKKLLDQVGNSVVKK